MQNANGRPFPPSWQRKYAMIALGAASSQCLPARLVGSAGGNTVRQWQKASFLYSIYTLKD